MKSLYQLTEDLIIFKSQDARVSKLLEKYPYIGEEMGSFIHQSSLVLLTIIGYASKRFLRNNFFNRPSILAKMLDNFNALDAMMVF